MYFLLFIFIRTTGKEQVILYSSKFWDTRRQHFFNSHRLTIHNQKNYEERCSSAPNTKKNQSFFKVGSTPNMGLELMTRDQESNAPTEPAGHPEISTLKSLSDYLQVFRQQRQQNFETTYQSLVFPRVLMMLCIKYKLTFLDTLRLKIKAHVTICCLIKKKKKRYPP